MAAEKPTVSVLVPVLNEEAHLREAANAMRAQRLDGDFELLFIDGGSTDRTRTVLEELAEEDPRVRIFDNPRRTTPVALNIGLAAARGQVIARMDAHTYYPPDYLALGVERLRRGDAEHVSGPQIAEGHGAWSGRVARALSTRLGTGGADFRHVSGGEIEVDSGFAGLWWRSTLEDHGGWDEDWPNDQDSELAARLRKAGGRVVCLPEMAASYAPRDSLKALARQYFIYGLYRVKTASRHPESMRRSHVLAPCLALALLAALAPWPLRGAARALLSLYALVVLGVSARELPRGRPLDAAALPLVFVTMHLSWGIGFLAGVLRFGPPVAALRRLLAGGG